MSGSLSPGRPPTEKDLSTLLNGAPMFPLFSPLPGTFIPGTKAPLPQYALGQSPGSGVITSTGTAVNNVTTASPFAVGAPDNDGDRRLLGSMAGRVYLVSATASGYLMASDSPLVGDPRYWTVATQATIPPTAGTFPGISLNASDVRILIMNSTTGWLQWISASGTASLICTELF